MSTNKQIYPIETLRHSTAHLMAAAVEELFPGVKLGIGPVIEHGFFYDFDFGNTDQHGSEHRSTQVTAKDLVKIEQKMRNLAKRNIAYVRKEMPMDEAITFFKQRNQDFKVELLNDLKERGTTQIPLLPPLQKGEHKGDLPSEDLAKNGVASVYETGKFIDLCRGPHIKNTSELGAFKLTHLAGAYWRGSEKNKMLTRIYGLAFHTQEELDAHLTMVEEAEKRDHRKLGKELKLFTFSDLVGPGLPLWLPNGAILIEEIEKLGKNMETKAGYLRVRTPHIAKAELYTTSGHVPYYASSMFPPMTLDEDTGKKETYYLKGMNCPHHHLIYAAEPRSYRDLPLRMAEYGTCYRYEKSGELFGLMRVRSMQMNDAHIYCTEDQFEKEFLAVIKLYLQYFKIFSIKKYVMRFSTHSSEGLGKKYIDNAALWQKTEAMVRGVLEKNKIPFVEVADEAAFYGPKIDVQVFSAIGREFTLATNQVDFAVPARFNLTYKDSDGIEKTPLCIHRAPLSTHERLIGFLIEHYAGAFPTWLSPVQVGIIPVGEKHEKAVKKLTQELTEKGIRAHADLANETVGYKIRRAVQQKIPYMLVMGDKEAKSTRLAVRIRGRETTVTMTRTQFTARILKEIASRI